MRFAWLRKTTFSDRTFTSSGPNRALLFSYNLVWWIPVILPFTNLISFHAGFVAFFLVTLLRSIMNAYRINVLPPEKAMMFPFRSP